MILAIYNTNWYLLDKSEQIDILLLLHRSQSPVELTVGGLAPLNAETFVEVEIIPNSLNFFHYFNIFFR